MNRTTSNFFDSYAEGFSAIYGNRNTLLNRVVNRFLRKSMKLRYERTLEGCNPIVGKTVVDIGCGPGHFSITLAKRGAKQVLGLDFAKGMLSIAEQNARNENVSDKCRFQYCDFLKWQTDNKYDYSIAVGFMDYMSDPISVVEKILSLTNDKAFMSFPADGGILAWQRKLRYKSKCDLFMYNYEDISNLFKGASSWNVNIEKLSRDFFVTASAR
jgi:2-polyprenyl-3-methyl-5-hydroxy-6-metoxy-1,4-benzoquinol methylase